MSLMMTLIFVAPLKNKIRVTNLDKFDFIDKGEATCRHSLNLDLSFMSHQNQFCIHKEFNNIRRTLRFTAW